MKNVIEYISELLKQGYDVRFLVGIANQITIGLSKNGRNKTQNIPNDHHFVEGERLKGLLEYMKSEVDKIIYFASVDRMKLEEDGVGAIIIFHREGDHMLVDETYVQKPCGTVELIDIPDTKDEFQSKLGDFVMKYDIKSPNIRES